MLGLVNFIAQHKSKSITFIPSPIILNFEANQRIYKAVLPEL